MLPGTYKCNTSTEGLKGHRPIQLMRSRAVLWRTLLPPLPRSWITQVMLSREDRSMASFYFWWVMCQHVRGTSSFSPSITGLCLTCPSANVKKARHLTKSKYPITKLSLPPKPAAPAPSCIHLPKLFCSKAYLFFCLTVSLCNPLRDFELGTKEEKHFQSVGSHLVVEYQERPTQP